jgi:hypothetical protein
MVYANETDGHEVPSLWASHDPEGAVHYFLGHPFPDQGSLRLRADGSPVELKIDYGPKYESVRVRKGYSRLKGKERKALQHRIRHEDTDMVREMKDTSAKEVMDAVLFLETLCASWRLTSNEDEIKKVVRALIATLVYHHRLKAIHSMFEEIDSSDDDVSFCDNGYSNLEENATKSRLRKLTARLCSLVDGSDLLCNCLLSQGLYQSVLAQVLELEDPTVLQSWSYLVLQQHLESI